MVDWRWNTPVVSMILVDSDEGVDGLLDFAQDRMKSFTFIDKESRVDKCEVTFRNADKKLLDDARLKSGQEFMIQWGYPHRMSQVYRMIVKSSKEAGMNFQVNLKGKAVLLDKGRNFRQWVGVRDSDAVREILQEYGYDGVTSDIVETPVLRDSITQSRSDARFIQKLARRNKFRWWIDASGAHFRPRRTDLEPYKWYTYRGFFPGDGEILTPGPNIETNFSTDVARIRVKAIDPYTLKEVVAEQGVEGGDAQKYYEWVLGSEQEIGDPDNIDGNRQARVTRSEEINIGFASQDDVNAKAEALYREISYSRYKMSLPVVGDPGLGAKMLIGLRNYSTAYSGLYYVREATHRISGGRYRTDCKTVRDAVGRLYLKKKKGVKGKKNTSKDPGNSEAPPKPEELERIAETRKGPNNTEEWVWAHVKKSDPGGKRYKYSELPKYIRDSLNAR